jgi:hypothetical protein
MGEHFSNGPERGPESEPTTGELIRKAFAAGYLEEGDLEYSGESFDEVIIQIAMYIEQSGDDAQDILAKWGVLEQNGETE